MKTFNSGLLLTLTGADVCGGIKIQVVKVLWWWWWSLVCDPWVWGTQATKLPWGPGYIYQPTGTRVLVEERAQSVTKWTATDNSHQTKAKMSFSIKSGVVTNLVQTSKALLSNSRLVPEDYACLFNYLLRLMCN